MKFPAVCLAMVSCLFLSCSLPQPDNTVVYGGGYNTSVSTPSGAIWRSYHDSSSKIMETGTGTKINDIEKKDGVWYAVGEDNGSACLWIKKSTGLETKTLAASGSASKMYVSGGTIYVAGLTTGSTTHATIWSYSIYSGAVATKLTVKGKSKGTDVVLNGTSDYLCGIYEEESGKQYAALWVNGTMKQLGTSEQNKSNATSMVLTPYGNIYISGYINDGGSGTLTPVVWKRGVKNPISLPVDTGWSGKANSIRRDDTNMYISGYVTDGTVYHARVWHLSTATDKADVLWTDSSSSISAAFDCEMEDGTLYVCGYSYKNSSGPLATIWSGNTPITFGNGQLNAIEVDD